MNKPVIFTTPKGDEMVILPRAEYDALLAAAAQEDDADAAAFDEAMAALSSGQDRVLAPDEMRSRYLRPGFLRGARKGHGLTQVELAAKAGIGQGHLSDIEAGRRPGSPETMERIARALEVPIAPGQSRATSGKRSTGRRHSR